MYILYIYYIDIGKSWGSHNDIKIILNYEICWCSKKKQVEYIPLVFLAQQVEWADPVEKKIIRRTDSKK